MVRVENGFRLHIISAKLVDIWLPFEAARFLQSYFFIEFCRDRYRRLDIDIKSWV